MPFFKTTVNIVKDNGEHFDPNWMDSNDLVLPFKKTWSYDRDMQIEDVDLWEVIYEQGSIGVYASWLPFAEFYLFKPPWDMVEKGWGLETYYGANAQTRVFQRLKEFGITLPRTSTWVEQEDMWLYSTNK